MLFVQVRKDMGRKRFRNIFPVNVQYSEIPFLSIRSSGQLFTEIQLRGTYKDMYGYTKVSLLEITENLTSS